LKDALTVCASAAKITSGGRTHQVHTRGTKRFSKEAVFGELRVRAVDLVTGQIRTFTVNAPPRGSLDATLAALGIPLFAIDLRNVPDWFARPHYSRQIGWGYSEATPGVWMHQIRAARDFDLLMFVDKATASR